MATATIQSTTAPPSLGVGEDRLLIRNLGWERYEALRALLGDDGPRMYYLDGDVELMSTHIPHERFKKLLSFMVEALTEELDIPRNALGSLTFKRKLADAGAEPDECYYLANAGRIRDQKIVDLDLEPPPDLVIEVEISSPLLDKLRIYAGIGVPELWRFDGETLTVLCLGAHGEYAATERSAAFPFLPMPEIVRFLKEYDPAEETRWGRRFRQWVRDELFPLDRNQFSK
jgi:Uma2 family endonuclease